MATPTPGDVRQTIAKGFVNKDVHPMLVNGKDPKPDYILKEHLEHKPFQNEGLKALLKSMDNLEPKQR